MAHWRSQVPSVQPLLDQISRAVPDVRLSAYDGSCSGPADAGVSISFADPRAFVRILRAPRGLGLARAWIAGEIQTEGDLHALATNEALLRSPRLVGVALTTCVRTAWALGCREILSAGPTAVEYRRAGAALRPVKRDLAGSEFHYGRSAQFYRHLLGPSMVYSCGMFTAGAQTLANAQNRKHEVICAKLRLDQDSRVLDIGCGWGSFLGYARAQHGCRGIGITASRSQYEYARKASAGAGGVEIRYGDYRRLLPIRDLTAAASIGMYEHVGERDSAGFFQLVRKCLPAGARYLNQAIIWQKTGGHRLRRNAFTERYIFPHGQLIALPKQLTDLEKAGFRIVSAETYGENYAVTLRRWIANLTREWDACTSLEGEARVRAWHMYLTGALTRFEDGSLDLAQVLAEAR